ncbi:Hypothetical protein HDN1F_29780 [gamma proteobacterium HdN1]|nr:Hypothetical protein HDN1F_29780 [gamma proteobacterium HdN1]
MNKLLYVCVFLLFSLNAKALDKLSSIPEPNQKLLNSVVKELGLSNTNKEVKEKIYGIFDMSLEGQWYSYWVGNGDLEKSKFKGDKVRIVELIIPNNNRIYVFTLVNFPDANQIFYTRRQFVEGSSKLGLDMFEKAKENSKLKKIHEADNYGFFNEKGFVSFEIYHVKVPDSMVSYIDCGIVDTKPTK